MVACLFLATSVQAQAKKKNPSSKVFFAEVHGDAIIDTGEAVDDLARRSVYNAQGSIIETKADESNDRGKSFSTMVYSNGTGAYFDADTRVELKQFTQEPFTPNRTDMDVEPSISQTQAFLARGTVGLCTSKPVAGSKMTYQTQLGEVNIRGRKVVIEATNEFTKISMLDGDSTVRAGEGALAGHNIKAGEQAVIRRGTSGQPNQIQISRIPPNEVPQLEEKIDMACKAKKTVYFEVRERAADAKELAAEAAGASAEETAAAASEGPVTAFDGNSAVNSTGPGIRREIIPIEVVPPRMPVENMISPSFIPTSPGK